MSSKLDRLRRVLLSDVVSTEKMEPARRVAKVMGRVLILTVNLVTIFTFFGFFYLLAERYVWKQEVYSLATISGHRWVKDAQRRGEPFKLDEFEKMLRDFDDSTLIEQWFLYPMRYSTECVIEGAKDEQGPRTP